nr:Hydrocephalus-inducing protein Hy-3 [Salmonella sp. NCTC 7297]
MKKVILGTVLFSLSGSVLSSSLQDQLAAVAQAEQQGKNEENRQRDACKPNEIKRLNRKDEGKPMRQRLLSREQKRQKLNGKHGEQN